MCWFGEINGWYEHNDIEVSKAGENKLKSNKNQAFMEKIFNLMDILTNRIVNIEQNM